MKLVILLLSLIPILTYAKSNEELYNKSIKKAEQFLSWLNDHKKEFAGCSPQTKQDQIQLCDGTKFSVSEFKSLFKMTPEELISYVKKQNIKIEIYCKEGNKNTFKNWCLTNNNRKFFKEVTSLHGQYLPNENTIALHSDSNLGSLIHEYLHYMQYQNKNPVYEHIYKQERIEIQNDIVKAFDVLIEEVQSLEKQKKTEELKPLIKYATTFSSLLMKFGFWQKLIDERNLFLTYIKYSKEFNIADEDIALAKKNMGFLCHDKELKDILDKSECL
jgi:hypothetical protein